MTTNEGQYNKHHSTILKNGSQTRRAGETNGPSSDNKTESDTQSMYVERGNVHMAETEQTPCGLVATK
jgi:hypothetical protein